MQASERAIHAYDLDGLSLVASSGAAMTAALDRAIERHQWIVATAWSPHWIFAKYQLRYLRDPKGILGRRERVHAIARRGFYQDFDPELTEFFSRLYLPLPELETALLWATQGSVATAVDRYIAEHPGRIEYWLTGEVPRSRAQ